MKQLQVKTIMQLIKALKSEGYDDHEIMEMPIYLGNDDELNGIHTGWYAQIVDGEGEYDDYMIGMINDDRNNIKVSGKFILIS